MDEKISLKEFQRRWTVLLQQQQNSTPTAMTTTTLTTPKHNSNDDDDDDDLFDCSALFIPPRIQQLDALVDDYVDQWKQLDERKISSNFRHQGGKQQEEKDGIMNVSNNNSDKPAWYEKHIRLPRDFDYTSKNSAPPDDDDGTGGDRIVSLQDPTQTLSYHRALWELFHTIPLASQIEANTMSGHPLTHTQALYDKMLPVSGQTKLDEEGIQALTRLRIGDRHGLLSLPPLPLSQQQQQQQQQQLVTTLQLECWKNVPCRRRRGSTPDPDRMVLEFLGTQTLLDVHQIIVELAQDDLWWTTRRDEKSDNNNAASSSDESGDDNNGDGDGDDDEPETTHLSSPNDPSSGFFFIEGVFYTPTGETTDYVTKIHGWLVEKDCSHKEKVIRWAHLGLTYDKENVVLPPVQDMASTRLEDLELRLAVRYMHIHHGSVECSVYAIDRKMTPHALAVKRTYPLIHDIWTPAAHPGECEVCKVRMGTIVTSNTCPITMGHRLLCQICAEQLQLYQKYPNHVETFSIWKR